MAPGENGERKMTQTTHTPGTWRITLHGNGLVDGDYRYQVGTSQQTVAYVWMGRENNDPELQANARLIAAAPELLEALEMVSNFNWRNNRTHLLEIVDAAIAKARGQS
jgi:hypothetical protein